VPPSSVGDEENSRAIRRRCLAPGGEIRRAVNHRKIRRPCRGDQEIISQGDQEITEVLHWADSQGDQEIKESNTGKLDRNNRAAMVSGQASKTCSELQRNSKPLVLPDLTFL
jgi:hypothetical protein